MTKPINVNTKLDSIISKLDEETRARLAQVEIIANSALDKVNHLAHAMIRIEENDKVQTSLLGLIREDQLKVNAVQEERVKQKIESMNKWKIWIGLPSALMILAGGLFTFVKWVVLK